MQVSADPAWAPYVRFLTCPDRAPYGQFPTVLVAEATASPDNDGILPLDHPAIPAGVLIVP